MVSLCFSCIIVFFILFFVIEEEASVQNHSSSRIYFPRTVIARTSYSFSYLHFQAYQHYFLMHRLAIIHQHPDLYVDYIQVALSVVDCGADTVSFGTVRLSLEVPRNHTELVLNRYPSLVCVEYSFDYIDCIIDFDLFIIYSGF